jgi:hypothetical protein
MLDVLSDLFDFDHHIDQELKEDQDIETPPDLILKFNIGMYIAEG